MVSDTMISPFGEKDEQFYWNYISFMVEGDLFRVPLNHFVAESAEFASRGYQENDVIVLPGVAVVEFHTFLQFLFPRHATGSTTREFIKEELIHILELATFLHFHEVRKVAIVRLERLVEDPIELILLGRSFFITRWVLTGLADISTNSRALSESTSELIGHRTSVRVYIIRENLQSWDGANSFHEFLYEELCSRFYDELPELEMRERQYRTEEDIASDKALETENEEKLKARAEQVMRETKAERCRSSRIQRGRDPWSLKIDPPEDDRTTLTTRCSATSVDPPQVEAVPEHQASESNMPLFLHNP